MKPLERFPRESNKNYHKRAAVTLLAHYLAPAGAELEDDCKEELVELVEHLENMIRLNEGLEESARILQAAAELHAAADQAREELAKLSKKHAELQTQSGAELWPRREVCTIRRAADLDLASGHELDAIGMPRGIWRGGATDDQYREFIRANKSASVADQFKRWLENRQGWTIQELTIKDDAGERAIYRITYNRYPSARAATLESQTIGWLDLHLNTLKLLAAPSWRQIGGYANELNAFTLFAGLYIPANRQSVIW